MKKKHLIITADNFVTYPYTCHAMRWLINEYKLTTPEQIIAKGALLGRHDFIMPTANAQLFRFGKNPNIYSSK